MRLVAWLTWTESHTAWEGKPFARIFSALNIASVKVSVSQISRSGAMLRGQWDVDRY